MNEIKVTIDNIETKNYPINTTVYDCVKEYESKYPNSIIGAKINNQIVNMNTKLTKDCTLSFVTLLDPYGYRMYQAALKFIFEVAVKKVFKNTEVDFLHSVPKGIMAEIVGEKNLIKDDLNLIKEEMAKIISNDEPIIKYNILRTDAIHYFETHNQLEKAKNIHNTNNELISIYKLENIYNNYYTELPFSTGKIKQFDLVYLGKNKIVLVYPSSRTEGQVPEYVHYDNIIETFEDGKNWLNLMKTPYLSDLNDLISNSKIKELINANELIYNEHIFEIAKNISEKKDLKVILISGPSSTGKTTTTKVLSSYLKALGYDTIPISVDDYYKDREQTPKKENGEYDFECLEAIDTEMFNNDLNDLINGKEVNLPTYDFIIKKKTRTDKVVKMKENTILLIEGLHCLNDELSKEVENKYKYKIYLSPFIPLGIDRHNYVSTVDLRLLRRIVRDNRTRASNVSETIKLWQSVREGEEKYIFPYIHQADVVVNTAYAFEVNVLKVFAEPLLYSVGLESPYYEEARRLIKYLGNFLPIPSEYISKDSILREFIG